MRNSELTLKAERSRGVELIEAATEVCAKMLPWHAPSTVAATHLCRCTTPPHSPPASAQVGKARAARVAATTAARTEFEKLKIQLTKERETALTAARGRLAAAQLARIEVLLAVRVTTAATVVGSRIMGGVGGVRGGGGTRARQMRRQLWLVLGLCMAVGCRSLLTMWSIRALPLSCVDGCAQAQAKLDATTTREEARSTRARTMAHIELLKGNTTATKVAADASASLEGERGLKLARVQLLQKLQVSVDAAAPHDRRSAACAGLACGL